MTIYSVEVAPAVRKQLRSIPKEEQRRLLDKIGALAADPRPHGYKTLVVSEDTTEFEWVTIE